MSIQNNVYVHDDAVRLQPNLVYDVFAQFAIPPGALLHPMSDVLDTGIPDLPRPISETFRALVRAASTRLTLDPRAYTVECWSNRSLAGGPNVDYHVDNDEDRRRRTGTLVVPAFGSIYYAGPDSGDVGGTWFDPPLADPSTEPRLFTAPAFADVVSPAGRLVEFRPGRLVLFDGRCPHCVQPFDTLASPRVTILANFWPSGRRPMTRDRLRTERESDLRPRPT